MSKAHWVFCLLLVCTLFLGPLPVRAGNFQAVEFLMTSPSLIGVGDRFADPAADYGIAQLQVGGQTSVKEPGGIVSSADGNWIYLAINASTSTTRMIKIPALVPGTHISYFPSTSGSLAGLVSSASITTDATNYVTNALLSTPTSHLPRDLSASYILGMTVDPNTNDIYAALTTGGAAGNAILRVLNGTNQASGLVEFAAPETCPQYLNVEAADSGLCPLNPSVEPDPSLLLSGDPAFAPLFSDVIMGPQAVAYYPESATKLVYFADGTPVDLCLSWAVEDLSYVRDYTVFDSFNFPGLRVMQLRNRYDLTDTDFFSDELRVHANIDPHDHAFDPLNPTVHADVAYLKTPGRMAIISGTDSGVVLVDDLNDNTESSETDTDSPSLSIVLGTLNPTAMTNTFTVGNFNANTDLVIADYDSTANTTQLVHVTFGLNNSISSQTVLDLTTPNDEIPGRVSELTMDGNGNIYAVVGDDPDLPAGDGVVYLISLNDTQAAPTPTPVPNFDCFETNSQAFGQSGRFTLPSLVDYVQNVRGEMDVITELQLIADGDLEFYLVAGSSSRLRFFYINRPITITQLDRLTTEKGNFLIFRSDGELRSFLHVNGRLISPLEGNPIGTSEGQRIFEGSLRSATDALGDPVVQYYGQGFLEETEVRYTSVVGFISWLKRLGVPDFASLNWTAPAGDDAAAEFENFLNRNLGTVLSPKLMFDVVPLDREAVVNDIEEDVFGTDTGRWGGIYFNEPDVGSSSAEASSVSYSIVEFAEVGVYALDTQLDPDNVRNENALRIVGSLFQNNLIGLSIDGMSPLVARTTIVDSSPDSGFDARNFGGATPIANPCNLDSNRRFAIGSSGTGVYITARRGSFSVDVDPLFWGNTITRNVGNGVQIQQPGVGVSFGSPSLSNQPRPLFGRTVPPLESAHEYVNFGYNSIFDNGTGGSSEETYQNFVYNVEELPPDFGVADPTHDGDLSAEMNYWGDSDVTTFEEDIRDGKDLANQGEVYTTPHLYIRPSGVEESTELYE